MGKLGVRTAGAKISAGTHHVQRLANSASKADELAPNVPKLDENTWHHHQDLTTMQEVNKEMYRRFRHMGGMSLTKKREE